MKKTVFSIVPGLRRISRSLRWRLGMQVAALELEEGTDASVAAFYRGRVTDCEFLSDPNHYEHPRARWILDRVRGGQLLEVGAGNGGMTRLMAPLVDRLTALDVSAPSLDAVRKLGLPNVRTVEALVEQYTPDGRFDWIVMTEVLEHLRDPGRVLARLVGWLGPGGALLVTTPRGHWESNEHLQEFTLERFAGLLAASGGEAIDVSYLRDGDERRRWLVGEVAACVRLPAADRFDDRAAIKRRRRAS